MCENYVLHKHLDYYHLIEAKASNREYLDKLSNISVSASD